MIKKGYCIQKIMMVLMSMCGIAYAYDGDLREMRGCIKILGSTDRIPEIRVLFNGKETISNKEGFFSFPLDETHMVRYALLITKSIKQNFDKANTIKDLTIEQGQKYRYFIFKKEGWGLGWEQHEQSIDDTSFVVPQNCVIVLIDPKYVDQVERWNIFLPASMIKLPIIILKNTISQEKIKRASAKSILSSLDTTPFHESIPEVIKAPEAGAKKVIVSLFQ